MSASFVNFHFVWRFGDLSILNATARNWRTAHITTPIKCGPGNSESDINWDLLLGKLDGKFEVALCSPKRQLEALAPMHFCIRSVLRSQGHLMEKSCYYTTATLASSVSAVFPCVSPSAIAWKILSSDTGTMTNDKYVLHLWIDIAVAGENTLPQILGSVPSTIKEKALVQYTRSAALPEIFLEAVPAYSDLVVSISGVKRYHVHRLILAAMSPVFDTMLSAGTWKEQGDGEIIIEDVDVSSFKNLLHYCYTETLPADFNSRSTEEIFNLVYVADKYNIRGLKEALESLLLRLDCTDEERLEQLCVAYKHDLPILKEVCELILSTKLGVYAEKGLPLLHSVAEKATRKMELLQVSVLL